MTFNVQNGRLSQEKSERKKGEESLRCSETLLNKVFDAIPDLLAVIDRDLRIVCCNWRGGYDYVDEEIRDRSPHCYQAFYPGQGNPCDTCHALEVFRTGRPVAAEKVNPRIGTVEVRAYPLFNESGEVLMVVEHIRDISESKKMQNAIRESEEKFRVLSDTSPAMIFLYRGENLIYVNQTFQKLTGYTEEELINMKFWDWVHDDFKDLVRNRGLARQRGPAEPANYEFKYVTKNGEERSALISAGIIMYSGEPAGIGTIIDITERRHAEEELRKAYDALEMRVRERTAELVKTNKTLQTQVEERKRAESELHKLSLAVEQSPASIVISDREGTIEYVNPKFSRITGYTREEAIGRNPRILKGEETDPAVYRDLWETITSGREWEGEFHNRKKNGEYFWEKAKIAPITDAAGAITHFMAIKEDITERKRLDEALCKSQDELLAQHMELTNLFLQVEHQAQHDVLTSLPNRSLLADRIQQAILLARRNNNQVAVIFVDLDNLKFINDSLGHDSGDELLRTTAERLKGCVRASDTVARQGGDEFVIIISGTAAEDFVAEIAGKIREAISRPVTLKDHEMTVTCSIGISIFPKDGDDVQALIKNADVAMYRAKEMGRDNFQFYSEELNARSMTRMSMERHLRRALENNEFTLNYQPKVSLRSGLITGMEALLRWRNPELGMVSPLSFISLAEETGLIGPIGEWVLRSACAQNRAWQESGLSPLRVAVNVSARQFKQANLVEVISRVLRETGLDPHYLELEISESAVVQNLDKMITILNGLKAMGIHLAMDNFGSGYASLHYLKQFSFDKLKIDCSFIRDITSNPDSYAITRAVIAMAHSLHLKVIAEGVETKGQVCYLTDHGCDEMQGYYFSRPGPAAELTELLRSGGCLKFEAVGASSPEKSILVVDDEENAVRAIERSLSLDGYRVLTAGSAMEGFELIATNRVAVVISDQWMPDMNGNEFLSRVREIHPETVRILITGRGELETITDAINKGAIFKFLVKPWDDDFLRDTVGEALRHYGSLQHIEKICP